MFDLNALTANPKVRDMLMTAGLSMLANNQPRVGQPAPSFGNALGQGFLTGLQYANQQEEERKKQEQREQDFALRKQMQEGQLAHMKAQEDISREGLGLNWEQFRDNSGFRRDELALRKQYQEGQLSHLKNLEDVSWANLGLSRDQFLDNSAFRRDELAERKRQNDLAAQQHQASLGLRERQFGAQQDWQQRKFDEDVRRYNEEAPMRQAQQRHLGNQVQQENQALELQKARQQWIPAANRALQKVYQAKNSGQSTQLSDEEFGAIASVYGDKPEFLSKLFEGQYVPFTDPDTGQTMNVPIQLMMQYKMKQLSGGGDDSTSGPLGAIQSLGGALTGTKPSPAQNPLVSQYAQRVQQAMAGKTPEQQELIKQQMRQELSGVDPAFLSAIGL